MGLESGVYVMVELGSGTGRGTAVGTAMGVDAANELSLHPVVNTAKAKAVSAIALIDVWTDFFMAGYMQS
jgi:hypothetical protein